MKILNAFFIIIIVGTFLVSSQAKAAESNFLDQRDTARELEWVDYNQILHSSLQETDSILRSKKFIKEENCNIYDHISRNGNIKIEVNYIAPAVPNLRITTNSTEYCDEIYGQIQDFMAINKLKFIILDYGNVYAYCENDRLFRINMISFKYVHYGIEISSD